MAFIRKTADRSLLYVILVGDIMISMAFCEDNEFQRSLMEEYLNEYTSTRAVEYKTFTCGEDLLRYVKEHGSFDIYLLDVVMPGINGMEVATTLRQMHDDNIIIFTTASMEYAPMSYDVEAFYYLTKPIDTAKLYKVLDKACAKFSSGDDFAEFRTKSGNVRMKIKSITYVELKDRAPYFYINDASIYEGIKLRGTFREIIEPLLKSTDFVLCGVGLAVNLQYVTAIDSESLLLSDGKQLFFPRSAYTELKNAWKNHG